MGINRRKFNMENLHQKELLVWSLGCLGLAFLSCSDTESEIGKEGIEPSSVPVMLRSEEAPADRELTCSVYIFSQTKAADGYRMEGMVEPTLDQETPLPLQGSQLAEKTYRFLFVATPKDAPEIKVATLAGESVITGTPWEDIMLTEDQSALSIDNYYGIQEMTGPEITAAGKVEGHLTRLTGQVVFEFYKAGPGGLNDPTAVDPAKAQSVFDRIYQVDITYTGQPSGITFGPGNRPEPVYLENKPVQQTMSFTLTPGLNVDIPQTEIGLNAHPSAAGGARIQGCCFLPADPTLRVAMVFHYYDLMPVCEKTGSSAEHEHTATCYTPQTVSLNLPALSSDGLSIRPDHFTVHRAALPCDRVIDIQHHSEINIQTAWNISNSN